MGCDIHLHTEVKIADKWEHYGNPIIGRDYEFFAFLAGVRNYYEIIPVSEPKGVPDDMSLITRLDWEDWGSDAHSASFITGDEIGRVERFLRKLNSERSSSYYYPEMEWGYLFDGSWSVFYEFPDSQDKRIQDVRMVFWFDN